MNRAGLDQCLALLPSIHYALRAEQLGKERGLPVDLVPVPRQLGKACGMALVFPPDRREELLALLNADGIEPTGLFVKEADGSYQEMKRTQK